MPKPLLRYLRVNTGKQKLGRMAMPQIVKPDSWEVSPEPAEQAGEFVRQTLRL